MRLRSVSLLALFALTFGLGACDSQQDKLAANRALPPFDIHGCVRNVKATIKFPPNGCLISPNGVYVLVMRPSGALNIAAAGDAGAGIKSTWTTGSKGAKLDSALATFQQDGNLVIYDEPGDHPIWNSGSAGPAGEYDLQLSDSGNLTIVNAAGMTVWTSDFNLAACNIGLAAGSSLPVNGCVASPSKAYVLVMNLVGALNLAPVKADGALGGPIWTSGSRAHAPGAAAGAFQTDGNLVVYDQPGSHPIWNSMSNGQPGAYRLELSDAGEARILDAAGKMIWSSATGRSSPRSPN